MNRDIGRDPLLLRCTDDADDSPGRLFHVCRIIDKLCDDDLPRFGLQGFTLGYQDSMRNLRRDCRRRSLRRKRIAAGQGSHQTRNVRVFPRSCRADVAGSPVERLVFAEPEGRSPLYGLRHEVICRRQSHTLEVLRRVDAVCRPPDILSGEWLALEAVGRWRAKGIAQAAQ